MDISKNIVSRQWILPAVVGTIAFMVYLRTLAPSVGYIDSGELATVSHTLGIAHPTGYPLFTLFGRLFSLLPVASSVIVRLNVMSAFFTASAVAVFSLFVLHMLRKMGEPVRWEQLFASGAAALLLAFSTTFWQQAVAIEVYGLHLLLISLVLLTYRKAERTDTMSWWYLFSFLVGLSFTNHMTTILLAPALLFAFFQLFGFSAQALRRIGAMSIPFLLGLSAYLYLPLRAANTPLLSWGDPQTWQSFWWHLSGKQFRVWMFSSTDVARKQFEYFTGNLTNEFHPAVLVLALLGAGTLLFSDRKKALMSGVLFLTCIAYSINYDIHDIDSYFLLAYLVIGWWTGYGILLIFRRFSAPAVQWGVTLLMLGLVILQASDHWKEADRSNDHFVEDYSRSILASLPANAIVISSQWDFFVSPSYYFQHVDGMRPDVTILDKELFRRSWYFSQLTRMYPDLMGRSAPEISNFLNELHKFENDMPYDYNVIEGAYAGVLQSIMVKNAPRPIYVTPEIEPHYAQGFLRVPDGFLLRLTRDTLYQPQTVPFGTLRTDLGTDSYPGILRNIIRNAYHYRSVYEAYYHRDSLAARYAQKALE